MIAACSPPEHQIPCLTEFFESDTSTQGKDNLTNTQITKPYNYNKLYLIIIVIFLLLILINR